MSTVHISAFDLDHTLLKVNSSYVLGRYLYKHSVIPLTSLPLLLGCYYSHKIGVVNVERLHRSIFKQLFHNLFSPFIFQLTESFLDEQLQQMEYSPAVQRLKRAKAQGHYTIILSNSPDFLVSRIAHRFGVNEWRATRYNINQEQCFSEISEILDGPAKAYYLSTLITRFGLSEKNITAYSDSYLDLPFLQSAGTAIAVNPDRKLRTLCKQNHWQIL